jgi:glycosyltransferase involved in cell wall biosynthesis
MKILSFLNVSNKDDIQCDSGYILQRILANQLVGLGHEFCLVSPIPIEGEKISNERFDFGDNKFQVRFNFDWIHIQRIIERYQPDVLWINQPELAMNFRAILCALGSTAQIVTYIHYLPIHAVTEEGVTLDPSLNNEKLGLPILLSVLGSVRISDKILVQSEFAKKMLCKSLRNFRIPFEYNKIHVVPPPFDPLLYQSGRSTGSATKHIIYNHRLYKHYGTDFLLKVVKSLGKRQEVQFHVADLLASRNGTRQKLDNQVDQYRSVLRSQANVVFAANTGNRNTYRDVIRNCRAGLAAHRHMAVWSMSAIDCLGMGVPVVAPNFACYPEFIPQNLLYSSDEEFRYILDHLLDSDRFWQEASQEGKQKIEAYSPTKTAHKFAEVVEHD